MPQPIEPRVCRARHYAELSRCLALEAEHAGDPWNGDRLAPLTGGDVQGELSTSKGKVLALEARLFGCGN